MSLTNRELTLQMDHRCEIAKALLVATNALDFMVRLAEAAGSHPYAVWFDHFGPPLKRVLQSQGYKDVALKDVSLAIAGLHLLEALIRRDDSPDEGRSGCEIQSYTPAPVNVIRANRIKGAA